MIQPWRNSHILTTSVEKYRGSGLQYIYSAEKGKPLKAFQINLRFEKSLHFSVSLI